MDQRHVEPRSPRNASGRRLTIVWVGAVQYGAVGLGSVWGLDAVLGVRTPHIPYDLVGSLAVLALGAEVMRRLACRRLRTTAPATLWICASLGGYAAWLVSIEAFLWYGYDEDVSFLTGILRLLPFLVAIGPLIRAKAWLGAFGSASFFATSLAMLTSSGWHLWGGSGFFINWVS